MYTISKTDNMSTMVCIVHSTIDAVREWRHDGPAPGAGLAFIAEMTDMDVTDQIYSKHGPMTKSLRNFAL